MPHLSNHSIRLTPAAIAASAEPEMLISDAALPDAKLQQLYSGFENYCGSISNAHGTYPVSQTVFSNNNGRIISSIGLHILNILSRISRTLVVGNTCAPGFFYPGIDPEKGLKQFRLAGTRSCGTFIFNTLSTPGKVHQALKVEAEPFMVLQLRKHWVGFDEYLQDLSSKYRVRAKKVYSYSALFKDSIFSGDEIDSDLIAGCAKLLKETLKEKTLAMSKDQGKVIRNFLEVYGENYHIHAYYSEETLIGFLSTVQSGDSLYAMQVGYDSGHARETHIYQRMLYDAIGYGIKLKLSQINFGRTATEIKSTLGATPVENEYLIFVNNPVTRFIARIFAPFFYRKKPYVIRKPFK